MKKQGSNLWLSQHRDNAKTLEVLFEISDALTHTRNLDELYKAIHISLKKILTVDNFYIALHHPEKDAISFPYHVDEMDEIPDEIFQFSRSASLTGRVIQSRIPMIFHEQDIIDYARQKNQKIIGTVSKVWLGAPLMIRKKVIGVISIQSYHAADDFHKKDLHLLNTVSQHIALAIERKEFEEKIQVQQQVMGSILENSPVGICQVKNRVFKWVNAKMVQLLGYETKDQFTHQNVAMIYRTISDYHRAGAIIKDSVARTGKADFDFFLKRRDNSVFKAHLILAGTGFQDDPLENIIAIIADISAKEQAQSEKMEKERLQGVLEMAGAICHEINQPLQSILGYVSMFDAENNKPPGEIQQIALQVDRIGKITRRLSSIARYKTIPYPGNKQIIDIWGSSSGDVDNLR